MLVSWILFSSAEKDDNSVEKNPRKISNSFIQWKMLVSAQKMLISAEIEAFLQNSAAFFLRFHKFCRNLETGDDQEQTICLLTHARQEMQIHYEYIFVCV